MRSVSDITLRTLAPPLVGRDAEVELLAGALARVGGATGQLVVVRGPGGIGRTRLLDEVLATDVGQRLQLVRTTARGLEVDLPYAPLVRALGITPEAADETKATLARALYDGPGDGDVRHRVTAGLVSLVERLARDVPTCLVIDDAHHADRDTLLVVDRLAAQLDHLPLAIVIAFTDGLARPELLDFADDHAARSQVVELGPLADTQVAELAEAFGVTDPDDPRRALLGRASGNPFLVTEVLRADPLEVDDVQELPTALASSLVRRVRLLPSDTQDVLRNAAVLGDRTSLRSLALVSQRSELDVLDLLRPAFDAGLIDESSDGEFVFRHGLVRDALEQSCRPAIRRALHAAAARSLLADGTPPLRLAAHLAQGASTDDVPLLEALALAASRASLVAPPLAHRLAVRYAELTAADALRREEGLLLLASAELAVGEGATAEARLAELGSTGADPDIRRHARLQLADRLSDRGELSEARRVAEAVLGECQGDDITTAGTLLSLARLDLRAGQLTSAAARAARACDLAALADASELSAAALELRSRIAEARGDQAQATAFARSALVTLSSTPDADRSLAAARCRVATSLAARKADRPDAVSVLRGVLAEAEASGDATIAANASVGLGHAYYRDGDYGRANAALERGIEHLERLGADWLTAIPRTRLSRIAIRRDELERARRLLDEARAAAATGTDIDRVPIDTHVALAASELAAAEGDVGAAAAELQAAYADADTRTRAVLGPDLVRAAVQAGDSALARTVAEDLHADLGGDDRVRWVAALVDGNTDALVEVATRLRHDADVFGDAALASEDAAQLLAAADRDAEAIAQLEAARTLWEVAGATRDRDRVRAALRALGVHRRGRRASRPAHGWDALTETERRVVGHVVQGLLYREIAERLFISRRTVETHVANAFRKVGVSSRRELAAEAERVGWSSEPDGGQ